MGVSSLHPRNVNVPPYQHVTNEMHELEEAIMNLTHLAIYILLT